MVNRAHISTTTTESYNMFELEKYDNSISPERIRWRAKSGDSWESSHPRVDSIYKMPIAVIPIYSSKTHLTVSLGKGSLPAERAITMKETLLSSPGIILTEARRRPQNMNESVESNTIDMSRHCKRGMFTFYNLHAGFFSEIRFMSQISIYRK